MTEAIGDRCMVVPTIHGYTVNGVDNTGKNRVVHEFAASRPGTQTPDWAGAVAAHPELMQSDDLHPTPEGADLRARLIAQGILGCLAGESPGDAVDRSRKRGRGPNSRPVSRFERRQAELVERSASACSSGSPPKCSDEESRCLRPVEERRRYMPGLDGLRAIAVLAVIAYHLDFGWAEGGLLGVGVFFTLSGYLITDILLAQVNRGGIRLKSFWLARARRLLPALFVMLIVVLAWVTVIGPHQPSSFRDGSGQLPPSTSTTGG